jgi:molybdopterin-containing oxidoreductase family membrane subunit
MVIAMWFRRYLIVVPTLETPLLPLQDTRPEYIHYSITWVEWAMTIAGIAFFLLLFTVVNKFMTIIPVSELKDPEDHPTHA